MPGHKRNTGDRPAEDIFSRVYPLDITEIDGFDSLHEARGILKKAREEAASVWRSGQCRFLVNGSTAGVLAAVSSTVNRQGIIIASRHCHRSVYHGAYLMQAGMVLLGSLYPGDYDFPGSVPPEQVEEALEKYPQARAVVVTSPTYEGIVSDIGCISRICHERGALLIVDEAHGAHFGFSPELPESSIALGADLVIQSLHKTLPSMTQTALLHINGSLADDAAFLEKIDRFLSIYQTSSPSYILMASMDDCVKIMQKGGREAGERLVDLRKQFQSRIKGLKHLEVPDPWEFGGRFGTFVQDPGRIVINAAGAGIDGEELLRRLREKQHIELEMASGSHAVAILTFMDTEDGVERLADALIDIDREIRIGGSEFKNASGNGFEAPEIPYISPLLHPWKVLDESSTESVPVREAAGRTAGTYVTISPPEIPVLVPGEQIDPGTADIICGNIAKGMRVTGLTGDGRLKVVREGN